LYLKACNHQPKEKEGVTLSVAVSGTPPFYNQPAGDADFISRPSQNFSLITLAC